MADISMCLNRECPRRNLCARHPDAGVYTISPRQALQGYSLEDGKCRGWSYKLAEDTSGRELAQHVLPEVWEQVDPLIKKHQYATASLLVAKLLGCRPLTGFDVMCIRRCALEKAKDSVSS